MAAGPEAVIGTDFCKLRLRQQHRVALGFAAPRYRETAGEYPKERAEKYRQQSEGHQHLQQGESSLRV